MRYTPTASTETLISTRFSRRPRERMVYWGRGGGVGSTGVCARGELAQAGGACQVCAAYQTLPLGAGCSRSGCSCVGCSCGKVGAGAAGAAGAVNAAVGGTGVPGAEPNRGSAAGP